MMTTDGFLQVQVRKADSLRPTWCRWGGGISDNGLMPADTREQGDSKRCRWRPEVISLPGPRQGEAPSCSGFSGLDQPASTEGWHLLLKVSITQDQLTSVGEMVEGVLRGRTKSPLGITSMTTKGQWWWQSRPSGVLASSDGPVTITKWWPPSSDCQVLCIISLHPSNNPVRWVLIVSTPLKYNTFLKYKILSPSTKRSHAFPERDLGIIGIHKLE